MLHHLVRSEGVQHALDVCGRLHDARLESGRVAAEQIEGLLEGCLLAPGLGQMLLQLGPNLGIVLEALDLPLEQLDRLPLHRVGVAEPDQEVIPWLCGHLDLPSVEIPAAGLPYRPTTLNDYLRRQFP